MTSPTPFGLSPFGFRAKRLNDVKTDLDNQMTAQFGDINLAPQSVMGQLIGVISKVLADLWENLEQVYFSQYPNSADGVALDNVVQFNAIVRLAASVTTVTGIATGLEGTLIPAGALARVRDTNDLFINTKPAVISSTNLSTTTIAVTALVGQIYTILLNSLPFRYSLPHIVFSSTFTSGDVSTIIVNNVNLGTVSFVSTSNAMLAAIAAKIETDTINVLSATPTNPSTIDVIPKPGRYVEINGIITTGGSAPTITLTFNVPDTLADVATALAEVINASDQPVTAVDSMANINLFSTSSDVPFSVSLGTALSLTSIASPVFFEAQENGPIPVPPNTLQQIVTPIAGWQALTNFDAGALGRFLETDAELRLRRLNSLRLLGRGTVEAIRAHLLAIGTVSALVFENRTMLQNPSFFTISSDLVSGDEITVQLNGITQTPIPFTTSSANTMTLLASQILAFQGVNTAVVGGAGNRTISMTFLQGYEVIINSVLVDPSINDVIISNGRPPKSFEAVVQGQTDANIANTIWQNKPAGIQTFGNTSFPITDSQGNTQVIFFSRPTEIFIWVNVVLTLYTEETFPANGLDLVQESIYNYINNLGIGIDVLLQRVNAQIFNIPGIASGVMTMAATLSTSEAPVLAADDISIGENQIALTQLNLITVTL